MIEAKISGAVAPPFPNNVERWMVAGVLGEGGGEMLAQRIPFKIQIFFL
jgi:hypothetical protein